MVNEMEAVQAEDNHDYPTDSVTAESRKDRRKAAKKEKRKKKRQEMAELARREEDARLNDPEELMRLQTEEEQERLRVEKERKEFGERERKIIEEWERRKAEEEEEERRIRAQEEEEDQSKQNQIGCEDEEDENGWEYVDGPPEIIWQGNEIIVKKKKIRVKKKDIGQPSTEEDSNRPTSNPLAPQSEAFPDSKSSSILSAQELLENFAQETPNFGTEQDKSHCPFHLKTGACRFGSRCSRIHFYPDKSCTLLIKNMYNGPGLAWEQDEGLECTDEEVERAYEEFYEDVHTEFLKFGEIVNFKVCRNGSSHLRGNVYVHYKSLDSAVMAYQSLNGRFYAGKQAQCEFVGIKRWKVAICGEFMKSKLRTCSRGTVCNFIHCFRNPGGDYEWADWDKPPPKYWVNKMAALFGDSDECGYGKLIERESPRLSRRSSRISADDTYRYHSRRSQSKEIYDSRSSRKYSEDSARGHYCRSAEGKQLEVLNEDASSGSDSNKTTSRNRFCSHKNRKFDSRTIKSYEMSLHNSNSDTDDLNHHSHKRSRRHKENKYERHRGQDIMTRGRQQILESMSPDDYWDARVSKLTTDWSDEEPEGAYAHKEKPSGHYSSDDKKSTKRSVHKRKHYRIGDDSEAKYRYSHGRSYRFFDSSTRYCVKDMGEVRQSEPKKQYKDRPKRSKRERGSDEKFDSKSHEAEISCSTDDGIDKRGRWESNDGDR